MYCKSVGLEDSVDDGLQVFIRSRNIIINTTFTTPNLGLDLITIRFCVSGYSKFRYFLWWFVTLSFDQPYVSHQHARQDDSSTITRIFDTPLDLTYVGFFSGPPDVKDKRMIEDLTVQASMISVSSASPIKALQTDIYTSRVILRK